MMSLREFAKLAGVSVATASRVFSGKGAVAPATRDRLLDLAERSGFRPSAIGQVAFGGKTRSVGVLMGRLDIEYFAHIASGIQDRLLAEDYLPVLLQKFTVDANLDDRQALTRLLDHRIDGVIMGITDERLTREDFMPIIKNDLPVVLLGPQTAGWICDSVRTDDVEGGRLMGQHLTGLGHRRIGYTYFGEGASPADLRVEGLRRALQDAGIPVRQDLRAAAPVRVPDHEKRFRDNLRALLSGPERPTALFATNDLHAFTAYEVARETGLSVPRDLSIGGFADLRFARALDPPLTTVHQDGYAVGRKAAEKMLERLRGSDRDPGTFLVPTRLVVRESTAEPVSG